MLLLLLLLRLLLLLLLLQAVPPSDNLASKLKATCPSLWANQGGSKGAYCCTPDQVDQLASNVSAVGPPSQWAALPGDPLTHTPTPWQTIPTLMLSNLDSNLDVFYL
jgi:hypothetical protein